MRKINNISSYAAPFLQANVDTDLIVRAERCVYAKTEELGRYAFETQRYLRMSEDGLDAVENPDFIFNQAPFRGAQIIIGGPNFGCGSSRETAVRALDRMGIRCIIAPSFGEIFAGNCFQNGLLTIILPWETVQRIGKRFLAEPLSASIHVDLAAQRIRLADGGEIAFDYDPMRKRALLEGLDEIGMTLAMEDRITAFQAADRTRRPWIYPHGEGP
jgi:3-isopropylmalate/(R)-2-methylmalate dehydratase small subunit